MTDEPKKATVIIQGTGAGNMGFLNALAGGVGRMTEIKPVSAAPTYVGPGGPMWRVDWEAVQRKNAPGEEHAVVGSWLVRAPWAHPMWDSYTLTLCHLRPMANGQETRFYLAGATHELWLDAVDYESDLDALLIRHERPGNPEKGPAWRWLTPKNFAAQFIAADDAEAEARVDSAARAIADGMLNPDTDARSSWERLFGRNMIKGDAL